MTAEPAATRPAGSCYGFAVESSLTFEYLRAGGGDRMVVEEHDDAVATATAAPLIEWVPSPDKPFEAKLYAVAPDRYRLWVAGLGDYHIDAAENRIAVPADAPPIPREERLWGVPMAMCFWRRGDLSLHASAVEIDGQALLFAAPGRFGKTTMATAFLEAGYRVLTEDAACCALDERPPAVRPGPAMLRVRPDNDRALAMPGTRVVGRDDDRVHLAVDTHRGTGDPVPIRAIMFLRGGDEFFIERVDAAESLRDFWHLTFSLPTEDDRVRCFHGITRLAGAVDVFNLYRPLVRDDLPILVERVVNACFSD